MSFTIVLEDDTDLNQTVCSFLNQSGYEAAGCLNASDAYDAMYNNTFDLIVSDIMMPGIDVVVLSIFFTVLGGIRRRFTVERPVWRIVGAAKKS